MTAIAPISKAERQVVDAAVLWTTDQTCSNALACLEDAVADLLALRRETRAARAAGTEGR